MQGVPKFAFVIFLLGCTRVCEAQLLKVGVAGLTHDHAYGLMQQYKRGEVIILGIAESNQSLVERYKKAYALHDTLFFPTLTALLQRHKPDAVLAYNAISEHLAVVEACAPKGVSVMVEKPLATTVMAAERMVSLASQYKIQVLTNYETTWYGSNQHLFSLVSEGKVGEIRKMVAHDGHEGPREIGCSEDFLNWLTDPEKNGGGAIVDFGCYGANLMTWLMKGRRPVAVTAITRTIKPNIYPKVDDEANILVDYGDATGIIEASWNWPFGIKDLEVYGTKGHLQAVDGNTLWNWKNRSTYEVESVGPPAYRDNLLYLADVLHGKIKPGNDLSSLGNNVIVVKILEAARQSAREGRRIMLN